jgi:hypothetical protein
MVNMGSIYPGRVFSCMVTSGPRPRINDRPAGDVAGQRLAAGWRRPAGPEWRDPAVAW